MPDTTTVRQVIAVDPDGVPVALQDAAGDQLDGVLYGAARAGGAVALIVTELDHFSRQPTGPPTRGQLRALADALDNNPNDPHLLHGSRLWWKEEAARLRADRERAVLRADQLAADVEQCQESIRQYAADADAAAETVTTLNAQLREQAAELDRAHRQLSTRKYGDGAVRLAKAAAAVATRIEERDRAARQLCVATGGALLLGWLIGRGR